MLKNIRNKKAQNTAEYAILIALVIGGVVAMQTYAQRALQARVRDTSRYMAEGTSNAAGGMGAGFGTVQYEPYYSNTTETSGKTSSDAKWRTGDVGAGNAQTNTAKTAQTDRTEYNGVKGD